MQIKVVNDPSQETLEQLGVTQWPIWEKETSTFPWTYDADEICYILEGHVRVTPENGEPVEIKAGDLVTFPKGMSCTWEVIEPIRKHYHFS